MTDLLKLYQVTMTVTTVILAPNMMEANRAFRNNTGDILDGSEKEIDVDHEITSLDDLPPDWTADSMPYGVVRNTLNIGQCLELVPPVIERDTKTIDMFAGVAP